MADAELQAIRRRLRATERQIAALESLDRLSRTDRLRLASLLDEAGWLTLQEGILAIEEPAAAQCATTSNVIPITK